MFKSILAVVSVVSASVALGDQCAAITKAQLDAALQFVKAGDTVISHCPSCDDTSKTPVSVASVDGREVEPLSEDDIYTWELLLNGEYVDLAYTYVKTAEDKDTYTNLGTLSGCENDAPLKISLAE